MIDLSFSKPQTEKSALYAGQFSLKRSQVSHVSSTLINDGLGRLSSDLLALASIRQLYDHRSHRH